MTLQNRLKIQVVRCYFCLKLIICLFSHCFLGFHRSHIKQTDIFLETDTSNIFSHMSAWIGWISWYLLIRYKSRSLKVKNITFLWQNFLLTGINNQTIMLIIQWHSVDRSFLNPQFSTGAAYKAQRECWQWGNCSTRSNTGLNFHCWIPKIRLAYWQGSSIDPRNRSNCLWDLDMCP